MDQRTELLGLLREHSHKRGTFTLASGKQSDFYIDVRRVALSAPGHRLLGTLLLDAIEGRRARGKSRGDHTVDAVAGVELGGCPLASAVSLTSEIRLDVEALPAVYVRKKAKEHGTGNLVEAPFGMVRDDRVVLVEDVITSGGSSLRAIEAIREAGYFVTQVIVVVDRQEGGVKAVKKVVPNVTALFTRGDFLT